MSWTIGIIVATFNKPAYLRTVLQQLRSQTVPADQIIVADDGSGDETREVCQAFEDKLNGFTHVWQNDVGFRKCEILNKALKACNTDYVIFIDDDCLCPDQFVQIHMSNAKPGFFTVGSSVDLVDETTRNILSDRDEVERFLELGPAAKMRSVQTGSRGGWAKMFLRVFAAGRPGSWVLDRLYLGRGVFRGGNSGAWRADLEKVNGFNNEMKYGHEDREIGERLRNAGVKPRQVRYSAPNFHLEHGRSYVDQQLIEKHRTIYRAVRKEGRVVCENGLEQVG